MEKLLFAGWVPRGTPRKGESGSQDGSDDFSGFEIKNS